MKQIDHSFSDIPNEVLWVWYVTHLYGKTIGVGAKTMDEINIIIDKYPDYFQWEHTYKKIPQSVHDAYLDEVYPDRHKKVDWNIEKSDRSYNGIIPEINASNNQKEYSKNITDDELFEWVKDTWDKEHERKINEQKEEARKEKIWNKHYKKYGIEYRG